MVDSFEIEAAQMFRELEGATGPFDGWRPGPPQTFEVPNPFFVPLEQKRRLPSLTNPLFAESLRKALHHVTMFDPLGTGKYTVCVGPEWEELTRKTIRECFDFPPFEVLVSPYMKDQKHFYIVGA